MDYPFVVAKSHTYLKPKDQQDLDKWLESGFEVDKVYKTKGGKSYRIVKLILPLGAITPQTEYFTAMRLGEPEERYHTPLAKAEDGKVHIAYIDENGKMRGCTGAEFVDLVGKEDFVVEDPPQHRAPAYLEKMAENMKRQLLKDAELEKAQDEIAENKEVKADLAGAKVKAEAAKQKTKSKQSK